MASPSRLYPRFLLGAAALVLFGGGCATPYLTPPAIENPALRQVLIETLARRYPPQYRLVQRLALRTGGKQYDLIGYLAVSAADSFRAVAMGEMGGRIFDFSLAGGRAQIRKKPEKMPAPPLLTGAIADIGHLFLTPSGGGLTLAGGPEGPPALVGFAADGGAVEYLFDPRDQRLTISRESRAGHLVRKARYTDYRVVPGFDRPIPARILLENRRWRYTLEIRTLEIIPGAVPETGARE